MNDFNRYVALDKQTGLKAFAYNFHGTPEKGDILEGGDGDYHIVQVGGKWIDGYPVIWVEKV